MNSSNIKYLMISYRQLEHSFNPKYSTRSTSINWELYRISTKERNTLHMEIMNRKTTNLMKILPTSQQSLTFQIRHCRNSQRYSPHNLKKPTQKMKRLNWIYSEMRLI